MNNEELLKTLYIDNNDKEFWWYEILGQAITPDRVNVFKVNPEHDAPRYLQLIDTFKVMKKKQETGKEVGLNSSEPFGIESVIKVCRAHRKIFSG
jgi:hypothetical protein